jgi:hypothetical protein
MELIYRLDALVGRISHNEASVHGQESFKIVLSDAGILYCFVMTVLDGFVIIFCNAE